MGYVKSDGRWVDTGDIGALGAAQAGVTGTGSTSSVETGRRTIARLTLNVTAATGTSPSLTVNIQSSRDGTAWSAVGSFAAKTGVASEAKVFGPLDRFMRAQWAAPSGTAPSFDFAITGDLI